MSLLEKISDIEQPQSGVIKPLKPLVFNFFVSDRPEANQQTLEDIDNTYKSFHSQRLEHRNNHYFRPTINPKKLNEQPRFRLSVQKKRVKALSGVIPKASSEKPSRNSYRGSKVKTATNRSMLNQQELEALESPKPKKVESSEMSNRSPRKSKQPHLHFNLRHILQTSKTFTGHFSREDEIQGTSFPYYNYFSSEESSLPKTQKSFRSKNSGKII